MEFQPSLEVEIGAMFQTAMIPPNSVVCSWLVKFLVKSLFVISTPNVSVAGT